MKFSKVLQQTATELPELNDMFLRYKELKKQLKSIPQQERRAENPGTEAEPNQDQVQASSPDDENKHLSLEEQKFISTLNEDLGKFNSFFMEQEEEAVIQLQALTDELDAQQGAVTSIQLKERLVQFHGSCIMLMHWSLLNYAAVAKILKKHDKRTGLLLRAPYLTSVLQQPFNSTSVMSRLVKSAEEQLRKITPDANTLTQLSAQPHIFYGRNMPFTSGAATAAAAAAQAARAEAAAKGEAPATAAAVAVAAAASAALISPKDDKNNDKGASASPAGDVAGTEQGQQGPSEQQPGCVGCAAQGVVSAEAEAEAVRARLLQLYGDEAVALMLSGEHTCKAGSAGGVSPPGGVTQTMRALEMWRTLQATASTPSTVVPEDIHASMKTSQLLSAEAQHCSTDLNTALAANTSKQPSEQEQGSKHSHPQPPSQQSHEGKRVREGEERQQGQQQQGSKPSQQSGGSQGEEAQDVSSPVKKQRV